MKIGKEDLLSIYEMMWRIRKFEQKAFDLQTQDLIGGSIHLYIGEEAVASTVGHLLKKDDYICSTHRGHGHILGKGARTDLAMAEILGKKDGYCNGKGGSMHIADMDNGILGANGIVGGGIPCAVGAGLSIKMRKTHQVSVSYFGDGAANEGTFHESMNLAALWNLPVIFICENNLYGMTVPICESTKEQDIYKRAQGYGMYGEKVDGNDVFAVWEATQKAIKKATNGEGPSLLEFKTYRWRGHWEGDPMNYRNEEELKEWQKRDPIVVLENKILSDWGVTQEQLQNIQKAMQMEIDKAADFAIKSPFPDVSTVMQDIYTEMT